jgi:hypothetical protein
VVLFETYPKLARNWRQMAQASGQQMLRAILPPMNITKLVAISED